MIRYLFRGQRIRLHTTLSPKQFTYGVNAFAGRRGMDPHSKGVVGIAGFGWVRLYYRRKRHPLMLDFTIRAFLSGRILERPAGTLLVLRYRLPYWLSCFNVLALPWAAILIYAYRESLPTDGKIVMVGLATLLPLATRFVTLGHAEEDLDAMLGWLSRIQKADPPMIDME